MDTQDRIDLESMSPAELQTLRAALRRLEAQRDYRFCVLMGLGLTVGGFMAMTLGYRVLAVPLAFIVSLILQGGATVLWFWRYHPWEDEEEQ